MDLDEIMSRLDKDLEALGNTTLQEKARKARATARLEMILKRANTDPEEPDEQG